ncbi:hypothetical protein ABMA10_18680 [Plantibacter sp. RU18]
MAAQRYTRVADPAALDRTELIQAWTVLIGGLARVALPLFSNAKRSAMADTLQSSSWAGVVQLVDDTCAAFSNKQLRGTCDQATALTHLLVTGTPVAPTQLAALHSAVAEGTTAEILDALDKLFTT